MSFFGPVDEAASKRSPSALGNAEAARQAEARPSLDIVDAAATLGHVGGYFAANSFNEPPPSSSLRRRALERRHARSDSASSMPSSPETASTGRDEFFRSRSPSPASLSEQVAQAETTNFSSPRTSARAVAALHRPHRPSNPPAEPSRAEGAHARNHSASSAEARPWSRPPAAQGTFSWATTSAIEGYLDGAPAHPQPGSPHTPGSLRRRPLAKAGSAGEAPTTKNSPNKRTASEMLRPQGTDLAASHGPVVPRLPDSPQSALTRTPTGSSPRSLQLRRGSSANAPLTIFLPPWPKAVEGDVGKPPILVGADTNALVGPSLQKDKASAHSASSKARLEAPTSAVPLASPAPSYFNLTRLTVQTPAATPAEALSSDSSLSMTTPTIGRPLLKRSGGANLLRQMVLQRSTSAEALPSAGLQAAAASLFGPFSAMPSPADSTHELLGGYPSSPFTTSSTGHLLGSHGLFTNSPPLPSASPSLAAPAAGRVAVAWPNTPATGYWVRTWPAWLFAASVAGSFISSLGAIYAERGDYATKPVRPPPAGGMKPGQVADTARPGLLGALHRPQVATGVGAALTVVGLGMSMASCWRFWLDGRALAQRSGRPHATRRPNLYVTCNLVVSAAWFGYRFRAESLRDHNEGELAWSVAAIGAVSTAVFAWVQAISISASEKARGHVLFEEGHWRNTVARVARFGGPCMVSLFAQLAAMPDSPPELRQAITSLYSAMLTVANVAPLTYVRDLAPSEMSRSAPSAWRPEHVLNRRLAWFPRHYRPLALLALSQAGRLTTGLGAVPIGQLFRDPGAGPAGSPGELHLPSLDHVAQRGPAIAGIIGLVVGSTAQLAATSGLMAYTKPITHRAWWALGAASIVGTVVLVGHRLINEALEHPFPIRYEAANIVLGAIGTGLQSMALSDLVALSQIECGRPRVPHFAETLDGLRMLGGGLWFLWGFEAAFSTFPPLARETTFVAGQAFWILGISLATGAIAHSQVRRAREQFLLQPQQPSGTNATPTSPTA